MTQVAPRPELSLPAGVGYAENPEGGQNQTDAGLDWRELSFDALTDRKFELMANPATSPDLLAAMSARQLELMSSSGPLTVVRATDANGEEVFRGGTTLDRQKAQASVNENPAPAHSAHEGPRTITGHYEKQLANAQAVLKETTECGQLRLVRTKAEADQVRGDARQEARALLEPVEQRCAERLNRAEAEGSVVRAEGDRRANRVILVAKDEVFIGVPVLLEQARKGTDIERLAEIDYSLLEQEVPPALPLDMLQQQVQYSGKEYLEGAKRHAAKLRADAAVRVIEIKTDAQVSNEEEIRPLQEQADAIVARADRLAREMVAEVEQDVSEAIAKARERVEHLQSELELRRQKEAAAQATGSAAIVPSASVPYGTAPLSDRKPALQPDHTDGEVVAIREVDSQTDQTCTAKRPAAPDRKKWVAPSAIAAGLGVFAVAVLVPHLHDNTPRQVSPIERLADQDASVPKWFPGKAWQQELAKALQDPRVAVGPDHQNYVLGNKSEHISGLGSIPELLMFLGSMDNEHNQTGLVPIHTQTAKAIAKKMNVKYVVETPDGKIKATPETAYNTILITIEKSNEILDGMFKNPADKKKYLADPQELLKEFIRLWPVNDATGKPVALPVAFQQAFVAIGVDMMKGADHSDALQKLIKSADVQKKMAAVTALLKQEGVLTAAEEKSGF